MKHPHSSFPQLPPSPRSPKSPLNRADLFLTTVCNKCRELRLSLNESWNLVKFDATSSMSSYNTVRKDINRKPPKLWKADPKYKEKRDKIQNLSGRVVREVGGPGSCSEGKLVKIVIREQERGAKRCLVMPVGILRRFQKVEELRQEPRPFGGDRRNAATEMTDKTERRASFADEMQLFWRSEIQKYVVSRNERFSPDPPPTIKILSNPSPSPSPSPRSQISHIPSSRTSRLSTFNPSRKTSLLQKLKSKRQSTVGGVIDMRSPFALAHQLKMSIGEKDEIRY